MRRSSLLQAVIAVSSCAVGLAQAATVLYNNDFPDGRIGTAARPDSGGVGERETGDDFVLSTPASVTGASFTGLIPNVASISNVVVEIYRVFPKDSDVNRTSGAPTFSTSNVPTRVNSPSDVAFDSRESGNGLQYITTPLQNSFTVSNSVVNGISVGSGGEGPVSGQQVRVNVNFDTPFNLPADHYFFVPQVQLSNGNFLWLSANRPIAAPGTPFTPDLQSWIRDDPGIAPDWLRVGTDVVGGTTFNASFSVSGNVVPEPSTYLMLAGGLAMLALWRHKGRKR